jgi:hypothetical protein
VGQLLKRPVGQVHVVDVVGGAPLLGLGVAV